VEGRFKVNESRGGVGYDGGHGNQVKERHVGWWGARESGERETHGGLVPRIWEGRVTEVQSRAVWGGNTPACLCPNHSAQPTGGKERCPGGSSHTFCGRSVDSLTLPWTNGWSAEAQILRLTNAAACTMLIFGLEGKRVGESLQRVLTERSRVGLEVGPGWKIEVFSPGRDATRGGQPLLQ